MGLQTYQKKRDFKVTPEPRGEVTPAKASGLRFVIQKHAASHLHYDFRLELDGVLLSWAVPKGPSLDPDDKRLAMHVEDHPVEYGTFEGVIPKGQYGGGTVMLWDRGTWAPVGDPQDGYKKGKLKFQLHGKKLHGGWTLVRTRSPKFGEKSWLLIKERDDAAEPAHDGGITVAAPDSVSTGRSIEAIAGDADRTWSSKKSVAENVSEGAVRPTRKRTAVASTPAPAAKAPASRTRKRTATTQTEEVAGVDVSNPGKLLYPDAGITKLQLARYYEAVADWIVPHVKDRPLTLVRCPDGWNKECFYQKNAPDKIHRAIKPVQVTTSKGEAIYMMANNATAVVAMLNSGALELHPWGSTAKHLDKPDRLVFDFDPDDDLAFRELVEAVRLVRSLLEELGLQCFLKTTGGKGLHIVVPIRPTLDWDTAKGFTRSIAESLAFTFPERFTANLSKAKRDGKIFVDYLRNGEGATAVAAYSIRARANAPVATPIAWEELAKDVRFDHFNVRNVPARLQRKRDPWAGFFQVRQSVTAKMLKSVGYTK
ncbi:hypothetical protein DSM104443_02113 [Usitatibacter rugosus]|uniref:Uncharacterized protein n=1 Tax=Usitatibacter rugosus TaxID=2732067 RepID=A0A6M4GVH2_9PROT|nr:non-homologous end-joining DNA ligase [Usitatibacter rugosus]QJR11042.1 hypothetical protein DSM104443_02113 [Usitatibacter rugosus]